jgi:hypothetical protein
MKELGADLISGKNIAEECIMFCLKIKINRNGILFALIYGFETWSFSLRKGHTLRVFENGVLRKIFEPEGGKVAENWWKSA